MYDGIIVEVLLGRVSTAFKLKLAGTEVDTAIPIIIKNMNFILVSSSYLQEFPDLK